MKRGTLNIRYLCLLLLWLCQDGQGFSVGFFVVDVNPPKRQTATSRYNRGTGEHQRPETIAVIKSIRRGGSQHQRQQQQDQAALTALPSIMLPLETITNSFISSLRDGPLGIAALTALSSSICIPLTQLKSRYAISVGYGLSVAAIGFAVRFMANNTPSSSLTSLGSAMTYAAIFYGLRLASFLYAREFTGWKKTVVSRPETSRFQRIPFAVSVSILYAFMTSPLLYTVRAQLVLDRSRTTTMSLLVRDQISWFGVALAWLGAILEAVADMHKYWVKMQSAVSVEDSNAPKFRGPTSGVYRLTRHPNYTGEVLFWMGLWLAGVPWFGKSILAWLCSTLGLVSIVSIMLKSTQGLEKRQEERYRGQEPYEIWKKDVPATLFPFTRD